MYHVSAQGVDERMINVHYYYLAAACERERAFGNWKSQKSKGRFLGCLY